MVVFRSPVPLVWGAFELPTIGLFDDWFGVSVVPPVGYCVVLDPARLWLVAGQDRPAEVHPASRPGLFRAQLWRHDVVELFVAGSGGGSYIEFNLAPNGAWWSCVFTGPRIRAHDQDIPLPGVETWANLAADGSWLAAAALSVEVLCEQIGFSEAATANVALILESPDQRFLTVEDLGGGPVDFHRPDHFPPLEFEPLPGLSVPPAES
jgi:hypothetical protein